jgi:glycerol uptake facilitator-like aquaporin
VQTVMEVLKTNRVDFFSELLGTFALTLVAAGGEVIAVISGGEVNPAARAVAPGLLVMAMIYMLGSQSGAHFNPVVSLAFTLRQDFPWRRVPRAHRSLAQCSLHSYYACFLAWLHTWERPFHVMELSKH